MSAGAPGRLGAPRAFPGALERRTAPPRWKGRAGLVAVERHGERGSDRRGLVLGLRIAQTFVKIHVFFQNLPRFQRIAANVDTRGYNFDKSRESPVNFIKIRSKNDEIDFYDLLWKNEKV